MIIQLPESVEIPQERYMVEVVQAFWKLGLTLRSTPQGIFAVPFGETTQLADLIGLEVENGPE